MENASKALIMAASVLLAILIIGLGVTIFNRAQSSADTTALDATEINMFNSKFERYSGSQLGSQVKSLISFAISNASVNIEDPVKLPIIDYYNEGGNLYARANTKYENGSFYTKEDLASGYIDQLSTIRSAVQSTHTYTVTISHGATGLVDEITINY